MKDNTVIRTTKTIYPQIYAYITPNYEPNEGWVKIGYTDKKDVDERIRQQTHIVNMAYKKLWSGPAKYENEDEWFSDKQFHAYLKKFKNIKQCSGKEWFYYNGHLERSFDDFEDFRNRKFGHKSHKLEYKLRTEQEEAVLMTLEYASSHPSGEFLWNAKPRFGKTLTAYDLALRMGAKKVLVVTNRPAIANSWYDDFETFIAWQTNYKFVSTTDSLRERRVLTREEFISIPQNEDGEFPDCITFISLQDLKGAISFGGTYDKLRWVKDLKWDLLIIDEAHEGVDTFKTDVAFNNITRNFTLHLSGTPFKAVASGRFSEEQIYNWSYAEEQAAKEQWSVENEENNPYEGLPRLNLFSYQMSQMITDEVNKGADIDGKEIDFAFDLNEFFETNESGRFIHEIEVLKWLEALTKNEKYPFSTKELRSELKHTLWLLNRVASAKALERILKEHPVFEQYGIVLAAGDGKSDDDQIINQRSLDRVREAIEEYDRTITLSVGQLTTGVTVPEWTAVLMLSNIQSASLYMQAAFRAQNPWSFEYNGEKQRKENSYIFDFAPERTLIIYDEFANNLIKKTVDGGGTTKDREENIKTLLNFFPVIAEDESGKMVELDFKQVLTIPKTIKAQEVVKRGFMSNFLFQNISRIFASEKARSILEQLNPVALGKITPQKVNTEIDTKNVKVDSEGNTFVEYSVVISETDARFGNKVYVEDVVAKTEMAVSELPNRLANVVANTFTQNILETAKELAKEHKVTATQAELIVKQNANIIAREVEFVKNQADIKKAEAEAEYKRVVSESYEDPNIITVAKIKLESITDEIEENLKQDLAKTVKEKIHELTQKSVEAILQKGEEKKKSDVEDDIRARLRGFARTIPSFLMAYGTENTKLANFEKNISDSVFKEVTGITLDQFKALRDEFNFFNAVVFDESIQEFLRKRKNLSNYFDETQVEDIFDYIPPQKTNQIFTPKWIVKLMIDKMEEESPDLFTDKDKTFADLYVKSGLYLTEIVKRLFKGLEQVIPTKEERLKHILENQIYGFAPSEIIYNIAKNFIFSQFEGISNKNLIHHDLTEIAKSGESLDMEFDVVVGNPPYQESGIARDEPIYHYFYQLAEQVSSQYCLISPARFLFNAGQTPKNWNKKMINDKHVRVMFYDQNSLNIFPNSTIKGGLAIVHRDEQKTFGKIGFFSPYIELIKIVNKISKLDESSFSEIVQPQGIYRFKDGFFSEFPEAIAMQGKGTKNKIVSKSFSQMSFAFKTKPKSSEDVKVLGLINSNRDYRWISPKYVSFPDSFNKYRVLIPESNGSGIFGEVLTMPIVEEPFIGHTDTFLTIGKFDTMIEAQNCLKYIKTKFTRTMLGVLKITQHNSRNTWAKVPLQDFTPKSDIDWTKSIPEIDQQLYAKYSLDENEIAFIEEKVQPMD